MHCDYWPIVCLLLISLTANFDVASGRTYSIDEMNSVSLILGVPLETFQNNPAIKETLFTLIANYSAENCTVVRQECKLVAKYYRNVGPYKRNITSKDFMFERKHITEHNSASLAEDETHVLEDGERATWVIINLKTDSGYDYLKWTELVRIIYYYKPKINRVFQEEMNMTVYILDQNPTSYVAKLISDDKKSLIIIVSSLMGTAVILFIILIPLSNTKHCRKELRDDYEVEEDNVNTVTID